MSSKHGISKGLGDLLGVGMLFFGGAIVFVGFVVLAALPEWCLVPFVAIGLIVQAVVSWLVGRRTTTAIETFSLVLTSWFIMWGVINLLGVATRPNGWLLFATSLIVYVVGYVAGKIGLTEKNKAINARIAAARAQNPIKTQTDEEVIIDNKPRRKVMSLAERIRKS